MEIFTHHRPQKVLVFVHMQCLALRVPRRPRGRGIVTDPVGVQLMEPSESDFKITLLNIFKETQDKMECFS